MPAALGRLVLFSGLALGTACISRRVSVPAILPATGQATLSGLIERVNQRQAVHALTARVGLQWETAEEAGDGVARRYRATDGRIILARPSRIRLQIQVPVLKTSLAEMASDGQRFQLLIYPADYRAFIEGSNQNEYRDESRQIERHPQLKRAGPLVNVRPQHLTEAFLFERIDPLDFRTIAFLEEALQIEEDDRPGARKGERVVRSYYVLSVLGQDQPSAFTLRRKYWFDRSRDLTLTRQQIFGAEGRLLGDILFSHYQTHAPSGESLPNLIRITRPQEKYTLRLTLQPESLMINPDIPATAFSLQIPADWGDSVRTINLDQKGY